MARISKKVNPTTTINYIVPITTVTRHDKVRFNRDNIVDFPNNRVELLVGQLVYKPSIDEMLLAYEMAYDYLEEKTLDAAIKDFFKDKTEWPEKEPKTTPEPKTAPEPEVKQSKRRGVGVIMDGVIYKSITAAMRAAGYFVGTAYTDRDAANNAKIARNIKKGPYSWDGHIWIQA